MDQNPDREMQELMEEIAEDLGYASKKEAEDLRPKSGRERRKGKKKPLILGGAGILLLIFLSSMFVGGRDRQPQEGADPSAPRLNEIEDRLSRLEKTKGQTAVDEQGKGTSPAIEDMEAALSSLKESIEKINQRADRLEQSVASLNSKLKAASVRTPAVRASANKRYHEVRRGETLYSIAKRYDLSVDELRRLNHMGTQALIHPGQKLAVN